jgi:hypothetical protein
VVRTLADWDGVAQTDDDMGRKFNNTYIKAVTPKSPDGAVFSPQFFENGYAYLRNIKEGYLDKYPRKEVLVICPNPAPSLYQLVGGGVAMVRRLPARQWQEGLCSGNTAIFINGELRPRWGGEVAVQLFEPQVDVPLEQALASIKAGECMRLTKKYWLKSAKGDSNISLYRRHTRIGSWASKSFFWAPDGKLLQEEVKDELRFYV